MKTKFPLTPQDEGFIMLCSHLGDPTRPVLTPKMMATVQKHVAMARCEDPDAPLTVRELERIGVKPELAQRVAYLMSGREQMHRYVEEGWVKYDIYPITIASPYYPKALRSRLGFEGPCCLWACGSERLLTDHCISVVGSRQIDQQIEYFARAAGGEAGRHGYYVVSGNAIGTDQHAQFSAMCYDSHVISIVADSLLSHRGIGYIFMSENDYDARFSAARALSRNRAIHAMSEATFVSSCTEGKGGTWSGATQNLRNRWSPLACFDNGSPGNNALIRMGAMPVGIMDLCEMDTLVEKMKAQWRNNPPCIP